MTLAGILLFGRAPQAFRCRLGVDLVTFSGSVDAQPELRDRHELRGRLPDLIDETDRTIYELMRKDAVIRGLVREEVPEYPPVAIREALVNAVAHRSYALDGSAVQIRLYDDAIEISWALRWGRTRRSPSCTPDVIARSGTPTCGRCATYRAGRAATCSAAWSPLACSGR